MKNLILFMVAMTTFIIAASYTMANLGRLEAIHKRRGQPRTVMV